MSADLSRTGWLRQHWTLIFRLVMQKYVTSHVITRPHLVRGWQHYHYSILACTTTLTTTLDLDTCIKKTHLHFQDLTSCV